MENDSSVGRALASSVSGGPDFYAGGLGLQWLDVVVFSDKDN